MSLRSRPGADVPVLTAQVARASNPRGTTAMWVRDRLEGLWRDEDFASWYSKDGKPGLSPAQLATVSVLQFLLNLSDRQAAEAVRCRIDFKYALGLDLHDPGFHHSVLSDFRDRIAAEGRADELFDLALRRLRKAGLLKGNRGRQRTDSTYVLAAARELTRLELVLEAVRATLEETVHIASDILDDLVDEGWALRYGRQVRLVSQPSHPATRMRQAAADAAELLQRLRQVRPVLPPAAEVLRQILVQHFTADRHGKLRPRTDKDGQPPTPQRLESPYDPEARYVRRGHHTWTGYLAHTTETCDDNSVNVITDVATTPPTRDLTALPGIHARLRGRRLLPAEHLVDGGYMSVAQLDAAARDHRIRLIGPLADNTSPQHRAKDGFGRESFQIDFDKRQVTCPNREVTSVWQDLPVAEPTQVLVRFDARQCGRCPKKPDCTPGPFRSLYFPPRHRHELQARNRADQQDPDWQRLYASRSGIEGTMNELVNGHQMRRCRYRGTAKTHAQHVLTAIAINIERLSSQEPADSAYRPRPPTAFQRYLDQRELPRPRWWRQGA